MKAIKTTMLKRIWCFIKALSWKRICDSCNGIGQVPCGLNTFDEPEYLRCGICAGTGELR
jgi:hypothetical protein